MIAFEAIDHDEACAMEVGKRMELGCFEEQLITYSTCYEEQGSRYYFISESAENVYAFVEQKMKKDIYCIPVLRQSKRMLVPSGKRADIMKARKIEDGKLAAERGCGKVAEEIAMLVPKHSCCAVPILNKMKEDLIGCFEEQNLQIFEGLVNMAYEAKKITAMDYYEYINWLKIVRKTTETESFIHAVHERVYCGFSYLDEVGNIKYYYNAVKAKALEKQSELRKKRILTTPLLEKRYCFNEVECFNSVIENFKDILSKIYNEEYWRIFIQIYELPSFLDIASFEYSLRNAEEKNNKLLLEALNYYGILWHMWNIKINV